MQDKRKIECVCVYYPHWHRYPKGDEWFGAENWKEGEWAFVKSAIPRFLGHRQPIKPLPGYLGGANPADVEKEIGLAADAGIDVFLYDYYYYGRADGHARTVAAPRRRDGAHPRRRWHRLESCLCLMRR